MYYLEDLTDGLTFELGSVTVSEEAILDFAGKYDPQSFHLDKAVATEMFGGLIASGWHTASMCHRLVVDSFLAKTACMASPGLDEVKFLRPVFPEDCLTAALSVVSTRQSTSKPDRGLAKLYIHMNNQKGEAVYCTVGKVMIGCKPKPIETIS